MANKTAISWCDSTQNFWVGCQEVSPACDSCYAKKWAARAGTPELWEGQRRRTKTWGDIRKWEKHHEEFFKVHGRRRRIFINSLSDFFDNAIPVEWRTSAWSEIKHVRHCEIYLVTKRLPNVLKMLPGGWGEESYRHVVLISTTVNQDEADRDYPRMVAIKQAAPWLRLGLSVEPMLGPMDLGYTFSSGYTRAGRTPIIDWVICGGESGGNARAMDQRWARSLMQQCRIAGVAFHFKQIGSNHTGWPGRIAGAGDYPQEWPEDLRVREWPKERA